MKQDINLGAYGWQHAHWMDGFYPEDLPTDWRLTYYSNEFNTVLVPADYWQNMPPGVCEDWLDDVHPDFQFFIECNSSMFDMVSLAGLTQALKVLKPQLSALVFLDEQQMPDTVKAQFNRLVDTLELDVIGAGFGPAAQKIWQPGCCQAKTPEMKQFSRFAYIEDDLADLRLARALIQPFTELLNDDETDTVESTLIVNHPQLQAANLTKFRSVLEIMGH